MYNSASYKEAMSNLEKRVSSEWNILDMSLIHMSIPSDVHSVSSAVQSALEGVGQGLQYG